MSKPKNKKNKLAENVQKQPQKTSVQPEEKSLVRFIENNALTVTITCISIIAFFIFKDYLNFSRIYLFKDIGSDSLNIYYPNYVLAADYLRETGLPQWSHNSGMGQSIFINSVGDIFNDLLYLAGSEKLPYALVYVECFKILLGGIFFFHFLRLLKISGYAAAFGAIIYAFNGYMILCGSGWYPVSTECLIAVVLLWAFEKFFVEKKWYYLPLVFGYIASYQPFFLYMYGLLLFAYSLVRIISSGQTSIKNISIFYFKIAGFAILGLGISSVILANNINVIMQSPRIGGEAGYFNILNSKPLFGSGAKIEYLSSLYRLFSNDLFGNALKFQGWTNYLESPILYSTLANLVLLPQLFVTTEKRKLKFIVGAFLLCLVPFIFPYFRYAFWLFSGDYYRTLSLFMILLLIFSGTYSLHQIYVTKKINTLVLAGTIVGLILLLYGTSSGSRTQIIDTSLRSTITFFIIVYGGVIYLFGNSSMNDLAKVLLLLLVSIELIYMSKITTGKREYISKSEWESKKGYNDYSVDAIKFIKSKDSSFFRTHKDYGSGPSIFTSFNDAMVQKYYGSRSYNSFNQKYYLEFLKSVNAINGADEHQTRWSSGLDTRPLLQTLTAYKYILNKNAKLIPATIGYDSIAQFGDVRVLKNKFPVPLGVTLTKVIPPADFKRMKDFQKDVALLRAVAIDSADMASVANFKQLTLKDSVTSYSFDLYAQDINTLKKDTLRIESFKPNSIKGNIQLDEPKILFMAIPYDKGWKAIVDGTEQKILKVDNGLIGIPLNNGQHTIELNFGSLYLKESFIANLIFLALYLLLVAKYRRLDSF